MNITKYIKGLFKILKGEKVLKLSLKLSLKESPRFLVKNLLNQEKLNANLEKIRTKIKNREKVKVAFLIMYSTSTQLFSLFELLLKDDKFDPYIIINPDVARSMEHMISTYKHSKKEMVERYGQERVLEGYDLETGHVNDYSNDFDMMITNNPYDGMAHDYYKIKYWASKNIPIMYISYYYLGKCKITIANLKSLEFSLFWKIFVENNFVKKLANKYMINKHNDVVVTGYPKMDMITNIEKTERKRKKIIFAPHHSINMDLLAGFFEYADLLLELPQKYPDIDFVFRPHPLLIQNLKKQEFWGEAKTEEYMQKLLSFENVSYSTEGDYFDLFVNSDALIHDCNSFICEYLYTGHPSAFYMSKNLNLKKTLTQFGRDCIKRHYLCYNQDDICNFIDNVVIQEKDTMRDERIKYAQENIMINYPHATETIYKDIKESLKF